MRLLEYDPPPPPPHLSPSALEDALLAYGETHLGCSAITPLWLSCYVHGCRQELHADVPHGPWAFVLSLTPGGEVRGEGEGPLLPFSERRGAGHECREGRRHWVTPRR